MHLPRTTSSALYSYRCHSSYWYWSLFLHGLRFVWNIQGLCGLFFIHMTNSIHLRGLTSVHYIPFQNPHRFLFCLLGLIGLLIGYFSLCIDIFFDYTILLVDYYYWNNLVSYQWLGLWGWNFFRSRPSVMLSCLLSALSAFWLHFYLQLTCLHNWKGFVYFHLQLSACHSEFGSGGHVWISCLFEGPCKVKFKVRPGFSKLGFSPLVSEIVTVEAALVYDVKAYWYRLRCIVRILRSYILDAVFNLLN